MKIRPSLETTMRKAAPWEWHPSSFECFLKEVNSIVSYCQEAKHLVIFRGHTDNRWLLDSTFVRYVKEYVLGISPLSRVRADYRHSIEYQRLIGGLFLHKFETQTSPSDQLFQLGEEQGIDPWFEWMKRIQQYPEEDIGPLRGSFLLDWTQDYRVGLYFANEHRHPNADGALWITDVSAMGEVVHQDMKVENILQKFKEALITDQPMGCPMIFHPRKQIQCTRAKNQDAIYIAQMDLRCDLAEIWSQMTKQDEQIFLKLVLPRGTTRECSEWLVTNKITRDFIYPDVK